MPDTMPGFGNDFETEAVEGALPLGRNSPQRPAFGLYAEQLSGSPFTAPRGLNERSWLYRMRPSVRHGVAFEPRERPLWRTAPGAMHGPLAQMRWDPIEAPGEPTTLVAGMRTVTLAGDAVGQAGMGAHVYAANADMKDEYFQNADGELLFVPQEGRLQLATELGVLDVAPGHVALVPRGVTFRATLPDGTARGYVCENYGAKFTLPDRGPIGANCLANPRDFKTPVAAYEDRDGERLRLEMKWCGAFFETGLDHSPLDVVAWHGNYAPYQYDLATFSPVGAIGFDHPDPSIFTVLTSPSGEEGTANIDFVIFPPRWMVAEDTFRPPWFHRNIMSEFMGLIQGAYDAKEKGFVPGGFSLHNLMLPHGPDAFGWEKATAAELKPVKLEDTMAFMFESRFPQMVTADAAAMPGLQPDYAECWRGLERHFPKDLT